MVDINLFKDEEGDELEPKPEQEMDFSLDDDISSLDDDPEDMSAVTADKPDEGLGDVLDFEDDLDGFEDDNVLDLDDDSLLGDDFAEAGDEPEAVDNLTDYEYGDVRTKRTPILVWAIMGLVVIAILLYVLVLQPKMAKEKLAAAKKTVTNTNLPPAVNPAANSLTDSTRIDTINIATNTAPISTTEDTATVKVDKIDKAADKVVKKKPVSVTPVKVEGFGSKATYARVASKIVSELSSTGQFVAILLSGTNFTAIQYVSETPNVAKAMRHRIVTLLNLKNTKTSPEERHRTAGKIYYYGVVSGVLPGGSGKSSATGYISFADFKKDINASIRKHGVNLTDIQKLYEKRISGKKQTDIRVKIVGNKSNLINFIQNIGSIKGNSHITKLILAPSEYTDFKASRLKLVLEFRLITG